MSWTLGREVIVYTLFYMQCFLKSDSVLLNLNILALKDASIYKFLNSSQDSISTVASKRKKYFAACILYFLKHDYA